MITFTFNGLDFSADLRVNEISGRGVTPTEVSTVKVPGMVGVHKGRKTRNAREITIEFTVVGDTLTDLRNKINTLSERLDLDEVAPLVFSDEPDKTYFAILANASDDDELLTYGFGTLVFLCPDPYKYGPEMTATLNTDTGSIVNVGGTAPTKPTFELTATTPATFAMVANDKDKYNMVGQPADIEETKYSKYTNSVIHDMSNVTNWTTANAGETDYTIAGAMGSIYDDTDKKHKFKASDFGTGTYTKTWHGPALKRSLPAPLDNFVAESRVKLHNRSSNSQLGNIEMYLLDVNGQCVARLGMRDGTGSHQIATAQARLGAKSGVEGVDRKLLVNSSGDKPGVFNNYDGLLRVSRIGNNWEVYFAKIDSKGRHHTRLRETYHDKGAHFSEQVTQVVLAMQTYDTYPATNMAFLNLNIRAINEQEAGIPYIVDVDGTVVFEHEGKGRYYINGEDAKRYKNFGAEAFELHPGSNTLVVQPGGSYSGTVRWRPAYK